MVRMGSRGRQLFSGGKDELPELSLVLLGALGVGKSALTVKYLTKRFIMEYDPYLEDTYTKVESVDGQDTVIKIMDTYDKGGSSVDRYLKWGQGFVVVYSITNRATFEAARACLDGISAYQRLAGKDLPTALVGNKMDLERYRTVTKVAGEELASQYECSFHETSAAEDLGSVEAVFRSVVRDVARGLGREPPLGPLFISEDKHSLLHAPKTRRAKSPHAQADKKTDKELKTLPKRIPTRSPSTFRIFNKSFKIFN